MKEIVTHNGRFHADEVFAVAALSILWNGQIKIKRTRDAEIANKADVVVDVGGLYEPKRGRFDHHQEGGAGVRENGVPYAAFGLIWKHFGKEICGGNSALADKVERDMVLYIDADDNGVTVLKQKAVDIKIFDAPKLISFLNPTGQEVEKNDDSDARFKEAVFFARKVLERKIAHSLYELESSQIVDSAYKIAEDKKIIVLEKRLPWKETAMKYGEILFAVFPDFEGENWAVSSMPESLDSFKSRIYFPESWAGKRDKELADISGVADAIFCHNGRFFAVARSKEGATELAKQALRVESSSSL
ncbi:MAG: MYG1 family protein [bacterium]|nr:MYG1 family protein [bacterium]